MSKVAVHNILNRKQQNSLKDRRRSDSPKMTNAQTDADLVGYFRAYPFKTVRSAAVETG